MSGVADGLRFRPLRADEADAAVERTQASFGATSDADEVRERIAARIDAGAMWAVADPDTDRVLAHTALFPVDHWFGGRRVPCQHVTAVAVAPPDRGAGAASALMRAAARKGADEGLGLSLLFPATTRLYRSLGWEHAGTFTPWRLDTRFAPGPGPSLRPLTEADRPAVQACAEQAASAMSGPQVRSEQHWAKLHEARFAYGLDAADGAGLEAYVLVDHEKIPDDWRHTLELRDWAATTPRGLQAVVGFAGRHGTLAKDVTFMAGRPNPWALLVAEQDLVATDPFDWMARGLDLPTAIRTRGFPAGLDATVTFRLDDAVLADQRGPWRLHVSDGRGELAPAPGADVRLHARALGPLYTGHRPSAELVLAGLATGPADALALLDAAFAGPAPTLLDFF